jgi:PIN domain nuclease of toxin-antitoxin system
MRVLLDTHAFLWFITDDERLSARAHTAIADASEAFLSLASCWEMAIKVSIGKLTLAAPFDRFLPDHLARNGIQLLEIDLTHAAALATLPFHHRDPFDRLLAVQAKHERLAIVSADSVFRKYGVKHVW